MLPETSARYGAIVVATVLVTAGCLGATSGGVDPSPTATTPSRTTHPSSNETNSSVHYFHHTITPADSKLRQAIDIALENETVAATIDGSRNAVVAANTLDRAKYRNCSATYACATVTINYDWGALRVSVDLETDEVWTITRLTTPQMPAANVSRATANAIALDHIRQSRSGNLTASNKGLIGGPQIPICRYHGCFAVVVRGAGNYTALVAVDRVDGTIVDVETGEDV